MKRKRLFLPGNKYELVFDIQHKDNTIERVNAGCLPHVVAVREAIEKEIAKLDYHRFSPFPKALQITITAVRPGEYFDL